MSYNTVQCSAAGISVAGVSASFMEILDSMEFFTVPAEYQIVKFVFYADEPDYVLPSTLTFTMSAEVNSFIMGIGAAKRGGKQTVNLKEINLQYDEDLVLYYVILITEKAVTVTDASTSFNIIREAGNG